MDAPSALESFREVMASANAAVAEPGREQEEEEGGESSKIWPFLPETTACTCWEEEEDVLTDPL
jgi:hypothetical protein